MTYSPHVLQQRRAGGHGTSLNLREDPGSLPFALILLPERKKVKVKVFFGFVWARNYVGHSHFDTQF
jgi:hypothetical protein